MYKRQHLSDTFDGDIDALKNHGQHDHARPWYAGGTDRGEGSGEHYGDHLSQAQINAEGLSLIHI